MGRTDFPGLNKTYRLGEQNGQLYIECLDCGAKSFNHEDLLQKYCGKCSQFHEIKALERQLAQEREPAP